MAGLTKLGRYELRRVLGQGAMGVVYEGFDPALSRRVAVKTILKSVALSTESEVAYSARFIQEAKAVARLNHPNIVQVYDFSVESEVAYLVMEFIQGRELRSYFAAGEQFETAECVRIMAELLDALDFAHEAGVIHRDVKPANVMLDGQRRVKLADFGVARIQDSDVSMSGTMVGTPAFMSPEQVSGGKIDRRTDLFSAGTILYQMLTGQQPFKGDGAWTVAKKIVEEDPPAPSTVGVSVSPAFDSVVNKALAKKPSARFANARDFSTALRGALSGIPLPGAALVMPKPKARAEARASEAEVEFWRSIQMSTDPAEFDVYLEEFPEGTYAQLARIKLAKLREPIEAARKAAEKKARRETEERTAQEAQAQAKAKREAETRASQEAQSRAKREAEERAVREAQESAKREAAEKAKREAEEQAKREAAQKARREAEERAKREAAAMARREVVENAKREAEKQARMARELAKLKQQEEAAVRAKSAMDEGAAIDLGRAAKLPESPFEQKRSLAVPVAVGAVVVVAAIGAGAYLMSNRIPTSTPVAQAPAVVQVTSEVPAAEIEKTRKETEERIGHGFAEKAAAANVAAHKAVEAKKADQQVRSLLAEPVSPPSVAKPPLGAPSTPAAEKATANKATAQREMTEKVAAESAARMRDAGERLAASVRAADEIVAAGRSAAVAAEQKALADKLAAAKSEQERAALERSAQETAKLAGRSMYEVYEAGRSYQRRKMHAEAVEQFRIAAEHNYASAQFSLGWAYANGEGVALDNQEAVRWYRKAADQNNAFAQNNIAWHYQNGLGVAQDDFEAVRWYRKAVEQNYAVALNNLGNLYERGRGGLGRDLNEARKLYRKAIELGSDAGKRNLERVGNQ